MNNLQIGRRDFIRLSCSAGLLGLLGCTSAGGNPLLRAVGSTLPEELIRELPYPWKFEKIQENGGLDPYKLILNERVDLLALQDGWIESIPSQQLAKITSDEFSKRLSNKAQDFLDGFGLAYKNKLLPIGLTPWVMVFRNGAPWVDEARRSWSILLHPDLKGQIIFPKSPRLLISIIDKIGHSDQLQQLRRQIQIYDDINAMNWLLSGKARVAVLPLQYCIASLIRDSRLNVILPDTGGPLNWSFLLSPRDNKTPLPSSWINNLLRPPLSTKLLAKGWLPPVPYLELVSQISGIRADIQSVVVPSYPVWEKCWSLLPLTQNDKDILVRRWNESSP